MNLALKVLVSAVFLSLLNFHQVSASILQVYNIVQALQRKRLAYARTRAFGCCCSSRHLKILNSHEKQRATRRNTQNFQGMYIIEVGGKMQENGSRLYKYFIIQEELAR